MQYAERLAKRVKKVLYNQVQQKGYEIEVKLIQKQGNNKKLSISDTSENNISSFEYIKIILTSHDLEIYPMDIGDNPDDILDFISIENESQIKEKTVDEAKIIEYKNNSYIVTLVSPTTLAGQLIIKECRAKKVK